MFITTISALDAAIPASGAEFTEIPVIAMLEYPLIFSLMTLITNNAEESQFIYDFYICFNFNYQSKIVIHCLLKQ